MTHLARLLPRIVLLLIFLSNVQSARALGPKKPAPSNVPSSVLQSDLGVGAVTLHPCKGMPGYCGLLPRPLDPLGRVSGTINIGFEFFPHSDTTHPPLETIVANEGGPGYPSTGSRESYVGLFRPMMTRHDLLLVDQRGTGLSQAINCPLLQSENNPMLPGVASCGAQLGNTSYLYGSGLAADDLAAVLDVLDIPIIDLYGDSYGTFFSQTFAGRHPDRLRSVVLDSAYPVIGESPWYPEAAPAARQAFEFACQRSPTCASLGGDSLQRIETLLASLRTHPFSGYAHDGDGVLRFTTADATSLAYLVFSNATTSVVYRELDPAARAYLDDGDSVPLLRLLAENYAADLAGGTPPAEYSQGLFVAVSCADYPQVYDLTSPLAQRATQRSQSFAAEQASDPDVYGPFTISEFDGIPLDSSVLDLCLPWPVAAVTAYPPGQPIPPGAQFTQAPVLVLSGDLDSLTPTAQGAKAAKLFPHGRQVIVENSFHVTALGDEDDCASRIVLRFVTNLDPGDTSCADHIAEIHLVPRFASSAAELDPATATKGNQGTDADLRVAAAAAYTAGDALSVWWVNFRGTGVGLRGGKFQYGSSGNITPFTLDKMKWVNDVEVSGQISWDYNYPGTVQAQLSLGGSGTQAGTLTMTWQSRLPGAQATITGTIGNRKIAAVMYAP